MSVIGEIGTPACDPKPRGNPKGRVKGAQVDKRKEHKVIKKTKQVKKKTSKAVA